MVTGALRLARDPLLWFVLAGAGLFAVNFQLNRLDANTIVIDLPLVSKLSAQWQGQTGQPPTVQDMDLLISGYIKEEIKVREARALGLAVDDTIVRRRLAQKMDFLLRDTAPLEPPDEQSLRAFHQTNRAEYQLPERYSFRHIFAKKRQQAEELTEAVGSRPDNWLDIGQPFMLSRRYARLPARDIARLFGADFADALRARIGTTGWSAPIASIYGWHLVQLEAHYAAEFPAFEQIADRLLADWQQAQSDAAAEVGWRQLRAQYRVQVSPQLAVSPPQAPSP